MEAIPGIIFSFLFSDIYKCQRATGELQCSDSKWRSMETNEKIGFYSICVNLFLVAVKGVLGFISGSLALIADAIHSATDVISSATVLAGIKISKRKSKNFPYGLYKVENIASLISAIFIFIAGYEIVHTVFFETQVLKTMYLPYAIGGVLLSIGVTFFFSRYELKQGKALGSPSLIADAEHIKTDMLSSAVIMVGLIGVFFGFSLDKAAALLVLFFVFRSGFNIFINALRVLLDASIDFETMDRVKSIIIGDSRVLSVNALWGRNSGPFKFIEADIILNVNDLEKAHFASQVIEKEIRRQLSHVDHILIHYAPQIKETSTCAVPLSSDKLQLSEHFGSAPYFYIVTRREKDKALLTESYHCNPFEKEEKGKGIKVSEWLLDQGVDIVYTPKDFTGKGPAYVFSDAGVQVLITEGHSLNPIKKKFITFDEKANHCIG